MRRWLWLATMVAASAFAQEGEHAEAHHENRVEAAINKTEKAESEDVAPYVLEHLADSDELAFQVPLSHEEKVWKFPVWRIPLKANACPANDEEPASLGDGCLDVSLSKHTVMMWFAALLLVLAFALGANRDRKKLVPHGASQNLLEMLVVFVRDEMAVKNIGAEWGAAYTPFLLSIFFFILFMNLLGLFPWMATATGNLAVTAGLALCTFFMTQFAAIRAAGIGTYLKHLTGGVAWWMWIIMIPVEILGLFTKPFALTVRLFANMLAGHIVIFFLLGLIFTLNSPAVAVASVPFAMCIYFLELFVAFLQAYVFTILSSLFIGMAVAMAHHHEHDNHDHGDHHVEGAHAHDHGSAQPLAGA